MISGRFDGFRIPAAKSARVSEFAKATGGGLKFDMDVDQKKISYFLVFMSPGGLCSKSARGSEFARSCAVFAAQGGALHWPKGEAEAVEYQ